MMRDTTLVDRESCNSPDDYGVFLEVNLHEKINLNYGIPNALKKEFSRRDY